EACLALRHTVGLGPRTWKALLSHYGSAGAAVSRPGQWVGLGLARSKQVESFQARTWVQEAEDEFSRAASDGHKVLLWTDPGYPERLRRIPDPPLFLYCAGRLDLASGPSLAVVGSRKCSPEGIRAAEKISLGLSEAGVTIVSGMARGIDQQAHLAGLKGPGSSVAVLGTGLDVPYPSGNAELRERMIREGLLVSEFAPGTQPAGRNFPRRNRIISGLALGVLLVEAALKSGGRITARLALEQGREVYAVPGPEGRASFEGCRDLIEQGATPVVSAHEIILDLAPQLRIELKGLTWRSFKAPEIKQAGTRKEGRGDRPVAPTGPDLSGLNPDEKALAAVLVRDKGASKTHIDAMARDLGWEISRVSRILLELEIRGLVRQWPGMWYSWI
ncbi:MAG: DNA-processing protein DprA, partial [Thermodesulfobacteriota bacterium]|nr:DNA-processing protein DprA [Thermodesulfobacteriota bacterium]